MLGALFEATGFKKGADFYNKIIYNIEGDVLFSPTGAGTHHTRDSANEKCTMFLNLPEENNTKNFMAGLTIQNLSRELFVVADENGRKLNCRVVWFYDEFGTMQPFDVLTLVLC